ncbi:MAG: hypothetical protein IMW94_10845 [Thermoanaerobacter sp.]|nr:hypothetical protein [Thermoanaerobacter sp.]
MKPAMATHLWPSFRPTRVALSSIFMYRSPMLLRCTSLHVCGGLYPGGTPSPPRARLFKAAAVPQV